MLSIRPVSRNAEGNAHRQPFKTPSRGLAENRLGTVKGKGKAAAQTPFQSKTPFQKPLFVEADIQLKGGVHIPSRPFLDKTPFPNRTVNLQAQQQTPFLHPTSATSGTPDSAARPSSTRRHIRVPRNSQKFETPLNTKIPWDVNDDSEDGISLMMPEPVKVEAPPGDDFDEIEYMAPNTLDLPYQPPFDLEMPDFKVLGKALMENSFNGAFLEPEPPVEFTIRPEDIEICDVGLDFSLIPDEDPFFDMHFQRSVDSSSSKSKPRSGIPNARSVPTNARATTASRGGVSGFLNSGPRTTAGAAKVITRITQSTSMLPPSKPVSRTGPVSTSNSRTTVTRPPSVALKSTVLPRNQAQPATTSTISRSKSTTAVSRPGKVNTVTRPASSAAVTALRPTKLGPNSSTTTSTTRPPSTLVRLRPIPSSTATRGDSKSALSTKVKPQSADLGGSIVSVADVEADLVEDFMFDV
ncbi:hypothetical protein FB446DRAFT_738063 [Lentinula raphanica]|nr:hypothetical protein FB446DRAFT_738063 [Lentinula raphanica]